MSVPTIMTGMNPTSDGPTTMTPNVRPASIYPASFVSPPERMKKTVLA